jgi:hypothetical protein
MNRMYIRLRVPSPGIRARTPILFGAFAVLQTFTVAQRSRGGFFAAPTAAGKASVASASARARDGLESLIWSVSTPRSACRIA